ncbi:PRD domain-containing protein [Clostridium oryzae]|uniref:Levansucrase and sucrase synthesis operon antiterminator n=1 Tax=Clostridium oryzae TaxID=1450648 RepID=A0A1V4IXK0_9CLOT|nr:PRD domain-containing protein [Clostridium oryzae]OPJ64127.1 levansucrase and sucrase synthesis operon antiterminator [Clostridium oryzae]
MEEYAIKKVLNNNVVIAQKNIKDYILVGKGIGFNGHKGQKIAREKIENIYVRQDLQGSSFNEILKEIDGKIVGVCEEIISMCEKELKVKFNEAIHVSLPDHINFAFVRIRSGVKIENPFLSEILVLYPKEYKLAEKALEMINSRFEIKLPEDEVGFISMHINAAAKQKGVSSTLAYTKKVSELMMFISKLMGKEFNKNSLAYARTVTHINFVLDRVINKKIIKNNLLDSIKKELYNEYDLAIKVAMKIQDLFSIRIPEDEIGYIALHLRRLYES